ncbi:MAG: proteasome subunit beta [archaeon]|nr:proteasome subunit beta [archaeon]
MDTAFAIQGNDYILLATDRAVMRSIMKLQDSDEKTIRLNDNQIIATCGDTHDRKVFAKYIQCNLNYYYYLNGNRLNTSELANYTRTALAEGIRSHPYQTNCIIAGYDEGEGPKLFWLDYLGTCQQVIKAAQGYGGYFLYGLMDNYYKKDFSFEDGKKCITDCIKELKTRFLVNMVEFHVYKISKNGIEDLSREFCAGDKMEVDA